MRIGALLVAVACVAYGCVNGLDASEQARDREKRQSKLPQLTPGECVEPALVQYLLYYYLVAAQAGQPQAHLQADQMAAALLQLVRTRGTDPLPTLVSQTAGQAALVAMLQKVTENDTARLVLLLAKLREMVPQKEEAQKTPAPAFGGPPPGLAAASLGQTPFAPAAGRAGSFSAANGAAAAAAARPVPFANTARPVTGNERFRPQATGQAKIIPAVNPVLLGDNNIALGPGEPQARVADSPAGAADPARLGRRFPEGADDQKLTDPTPPPPSLPSSQVLPPVTSTEVSISTLVTTIFIPRTSYVAAVRDGTPTDVAHVHTVTHVVTATRPVTETIVVTPTVVVYGPDRTSTVYRGSAVGSDGSRVRDTREIADAPNLPLQASLQPSQTQPVPRQTATETPTPSLPAPHSTTEAPPVTTEAPTTTTVDSLFLERQRARAEKRRARTERLEARKAQRRNSQRRPSRRHRATLFELF